MIQNFARVIWSAAIMQGLKKTHVFGSLANTDYMGTIQNLGDKVRILGVSDIDVSQYTRDTDIASPTDLQDAATDLVIDQAYYFNFKANDVDAIQAKPKLLLQTTQLAGYKFRDKVDQYFAGLWQDSGYQLYSSGTTPYNVNSLNADDILLSASETFGTNNVPKEGRYMVIPEWFHSKLVLSGLVTKTQNDELYANGFIQRVLGWDLFLSNNLSQASADTDVRIIAGIKGQSTSFADSINSIEAYRPEKRFEDAVKGLYIFGGKVVRPDMTITIHATKVAEP